MSYGITDKKRAKVIPRGRPQRKQKRSTQYPPEGWIYNHATKVACDEKSPSSEGEGFLKNWVSFKSRKEQVRDSR